MQSNRTRSLGGFVQHASFKDSHICWTQPDAIRIVLESLEVVASAIVGRGRKRCTSPTQPPTCNTGPTVESPESLSSDSSRTYV